MKALACQACASTVFFDNLYCGACGSALGFMPTAAAMLAAQADAPSAWAALGPGVQACANRHGACGCNWLLDDAHPSGLCRSCRLNGTIPDLSDSRNGAAWLCFEQAKRRLLYGLSRFHWLPEPKRDPTDALGLRFDLIAQLPGAPPVVTGHAGGVVTLNLIETDDVQRESSRVEFGEAMRTVLGHLRHETAHYLHQRWIAPDPDRLARWRGLFGDESADYTAALARHHGEGPPADWAQRHISAYASAHPHEDWAETCAHALMIDDALETAGAWGLRLHGPAADAHAQGEVPEPAAVRAMLVEQWLPVAQFLNAMNRSLGLRDGYPFLMPDPVLDKLAGAFGLLLGLAAPRDQAPDPAPIGGPA